jgi:hypothetical protein
VSPRVPLPRDKDELFLDGEWNRSPRPKENVFPPFNKDEIEKTERVAKHATVGIDRESEIEIEFLIHFLGSLVLSDRGIDKGQRRVASDKRGRSILWVCLNHYRTLRVTVVATVVVVVVFVGIHGACLAASPSSSLGCHGQMRFKLKLVGLLPIQINMENEGKSRREARQNQQINVVVNRENVCVHVVFFDLRLA